MKKIILGLTLLIAAVVTFAFTRPVQKAQESKVLDNVFYLYEGTVSQTDYEDETKWVQATEQEIDELGCVGSGKICWIYYTDQTNSVHPPTLPSEFNPFLIEERGEKN